MNNQLIIKNAKIITASKIIDQGWIVIQDKKIKAINSGQFLAATTAEVIDCQKKTVIPGFIDVHVHGGYGYSFMDQTQPLATTLAQFSQAVTQEGVTKFCCATVTAKKSDLNQFFQQLGQYMDQPQAPGQAQVLGAYLEGPFISLDYKGAHEPDLLVPPNSQWIKEWVKLSNNNLRFVAFAPECDKNFATKANFAHTLIQQQIVPSIGHSGATFKEVMAAANQGVQQATHLYNGMSPFHHRFPGCVPAVLANDAIVAELICDGVHVDLDILRLTYQIKGADKICMISDAMIAKGCRDGDYWLGPLPVVKHGNMATLKSDDQLLAGSVATMITGFHNLLKITNHNWQDCVKMASLNAAKQLKIDHLTGAIAVNKLADLVVLDEKNEIFLTICEGKVAFKKQCN